MFFITSDYAEASIVWLAVDDDVTLLELVRGRDVAAEHPVVILGRRVVSGDAKAKVVSGSSRRRKKNDFK